MRLSLRLMAERGGRDDRLGYYLDNPIQLFVPARLLLGLIFSLATVLIARAHGVGPASRRSACCSLFVAVFILLFEHVLPLLIVRRNPERVLEVAAAAVRCRRAVLSPLTGGAGAADRRSRRERAGAARELSRGEPAGPRTPTSKPAKSRG